MPGNTGLRLLLVIAAVCFAAPLWKILLSADSQAVDLSRKYLFPSSAHWLGTDELGRDVFIRLTEGAAISLLIAAATTVCTLLLGCLTGLVAGYHGGKLDRLLMTFTDGVLALPLLPFLIVIAAIDHTRLGLGQGVFGECLKLVLIISLFGWTTIARLVRSEVLSLRQREFVRASRAMGSGTWRIMLRHILPNTSATLATAAGLTFIKVILLEAGLSFLGMGVLPPTPTLGNMLMNAQYDLQQAPQLAIYPGLLLTTVVLCVLVASDRNKRQG
jgi:peptide/nickel transport system permease protein